MVVWPSGGEDEPLLGPPLDGGGIWIGMLVGTGGVTMGPTGGVVPCDGITGVGIAGGGITGVLVPGIPGADGEGREGGEEGEGRGLG